jgi:hypothetical protein
MALITRATATATHATTQAFTFIIDLPLGVLTMIRTLSPAACLSVPDS